MNPTPLLSIFVLTCALWILSGCVYEDCSSSDNEDTCTEEIGDNTPCEPFVDRTPTDSACGITHTLQSRATYDNFEDATLSFAYASVRDTACTRNHWHLLFGNDQDPDEDLFSVNLVTDDESSIIDLGAIDVKDIPKPIQRDDYERGVYGEFDDIPVRVGHLYLISSRDSSEAFFTLLRVVEHDLNKSVQVEWVNIPGTSQPETDQACDL